MEVLPQLELVAGCLLDESHVLSAELAVEQSSKVLTHFLFSLKSLRYWRLLVDMLRRHGLGVLFDFFYFYP